LRSCATWNVLVSQGQSKLEDFFWEPFYQLLRQQMLAWQMEKATGERTRVLHISPRANVALRRITSKAFAEMNGETESPVWTCQIRPRRPSASTLSASARRIQQAAARITAAACALAGRMEKARIIMRVSLLPRCACRTSARRLVPTRPTVSTF